jgi:hypothetical protein
MSIRSAAPVAPVIRAAVDPRDSIAAIEQTIGR